MAADPPESPKTPNHALSEMRCPVTLQDVDLFGPGAQEHWYEAYEILHEQAPVRILPGEGIDGRSDAFILTRYADIARVVKDPERFRHDDRVLAFKVDEKGAGEAKVEVAPVPGVHHASVMVTGVYHPAGHEAHGHGHGQGDARCKGPSPERFERVLVRTVAADER